MYRKEESQVSLESFDFSGAGRLNPRNRWILLSSLIPWEEVESCYRQHFSEEMGSPAKPARMALGALLIKERLGCSDEEVVEQICENPYLQYFIGLRRYQPEAPFDSSMMVHFRKRFSLEMLGQINEQVVQKMRSLPQDDDEQPPAPSLPSEKPDAHGVETDLAEDSIPKQGKLLVDATCAPADIHYPTDLSLLNEAREKTDLIIDRLHAPDRGQKRRPRTYRQKARQRFLKVAKQKKPSRKAIRKAIGQQLRYLKRNLGVIDQYIALQPDCLVSIKPYLYRRLLVISELYQQQAQMYQEGSHSIEHRIVSISQPHVRPIVRGKVQAPTEFGAKLSASVNDGYVFLDHLDWNAFNESGDLIGQVEAYKRRFGHYPESVHADKIYRTRENRKWCKVRGIRLSGSPLGRPIQQNETNREVIKQQKKLVRQDEVDRIPVEGKFGQAKRRFSLKRIMTKLAITSQCAIGIIFLLINLEKGLVLLFFYIYWLPIRYQPFANGLLNLLKSLKSNLNRRLEGLTSCGQCDEMAPIAA